MSVLPAREYISRLLNFNLSYLELRRLQMDQVLNQVREQVWDQVWTRVRKQVRTQISAEVRNGARDR